MQTSIILHYNQAYSWPPDEKINIPQNTVDLAQVSWYIRWKYKIASYQAMNCSHREVKKTLVTNTREETEQIYKLALLCLNRTIVVVPPSARYCV